MARCFRIFTPPVARAIIADFALDDTQTGPVLSVRRAIDAVHNS